MKIAEIKSIQWSDFSAEPLIRHALLSPVLADPTFCFPEDSPDGQWHLFAHSVWGIQHYTSPNGAEWKGRGMAVPNAMRPYLYFEGGTYYLLFEKYPPLSLVLSVIKGRKWYSEIAVMQSKDLKKWENEVILIRPELDWQQSQGNKWVSNPCLVKVVDQYRLYFSASLVYIKDCGINEPDSIGMAVSESVCGPYRVNAKPLITVNSDDPWCNLSCGSIKVLQCEDGFVGFENGIYWDEKKQQSGSAIIVLQSADGLKWERLIREPVLKPTSGWRRSHIYACDVKYSQTRGKWYMYYNARNDWEVSKGQENLGLLTGK